MYEDSVNDLPDFVIRVNTIHDGSFNFLLVVWDTEKKSSPSTFHIIKHEMESLLQSRTWSGNVGMFEVVTPFELKGLQ